MLFFIFLLGQYKFFIISLQKMYIKQSFSNLFLSIFSDNNEA